MHYEGCVFCKIKSMCTAVKGSCTHFLNGKYTKIHKSRLKLIYKIV